MARAILAGVALVLLIVLLMPAQAAPIAFQRSTPTASNTGTPPTETPAETATSSATPVANALLPLVQQNGLADTPSPTRAPTLTATATRTSTPTRTATRTQTAIPAEPVFNGGFEQNLLGWDTSGDVAVLAVFPNPVVPHTGERAVRLRGSSAELSIQAIVPTGKPYLSYWVWIVSEETVCSGIIGDRAAVVVNDREDRFLLCNATETSGWVRRTLNLDAYVGDQVTILFAATTPSGQSTLYIDDVGFSAVP